MPAPIAVIHTSPATVDVFAPLLRERLPGRPIVNLLDDSILPELRDNGGDVSAIGSRWRIYAAIAKGRGAALILNACSSIGELSALVSAELGIPIVRVDAAMARAAVARGSRIAAAATLRSTLRPTCELLRRTAAEAGAEVAVEPVLVEGAFEALASGDRTLHDDLLATALARAAAACDVVVLAQASMARVLPRLAAADRELFLVSPPFAVEEVAARLGE